VAVRLRTWATTVWHMSRGESLVCKWMCGGVGQVRWEGLRAGVRWVGKGCVLGWVGGVGWEGLCAGLGHVWVVGTEAGDVCVGGVGWKGCVYGWARVGMEWGGGLTRHFGVLGIGRHV
jgi:hypothetical protein